jgi:hypothetical protein
MEQSNFMMSLLILGPESPRKDFNVFVEPLMEELQLIWKGVDTADALSEAKPRIKSFLLKQQFFGVFTTTQLCALFQDVLQKAMLLVFTVKNILFQDH